MLGYDIDGTLADVSFKDIFSMKQLLGRYKDARVLYKPPTPFIAITARGKDPEVERVTREWLNNNFDNCEGVYFVDGSEQMKITEKAEIVKRLGLDGYVDGKLETLRLFAKFKIEGIKLYKLDLRNKTIKLYGEL